MWNAKIAKKTWFDWICNEITYHEVCLCILFALVGYFLLLLADDDNGGAKKMQIVKLCNRLAVVTFNLDTSKQSTFSFSFVSSFSVEHCEHSRMNAVFISMYTRWAQLDEVQLILAAATDRFYYIKMTNRIAGRT